MKQTQVLLLSRSEARELLLCLRHYYPAQDTVWESTVALERRLCDIAHDEPTLVAETNEIDEYDIRMEEML